MRTLRFLRFVAFALFFSALLIASRTSYAQQDQNQSGSSGSVAEAARKAREAKKNAPKPKHSLTDDDLTPRASDATPSPAPSASGAGTAAAAGKTGQPAADGAVQADEKKEDPNSEAAWRKRFAEVRRKIADAQTELDVLTREAQKADVQYYSDPQKAMNEQFSRNEINEKNEKIAAKKNEIAGLNQRLGDLEDELRRAGGDPSWAR